MPDVRTIATGLGFPEGPIAMPDGSVLLVEIQRGTLSRVSPGGKDLGTAYVTLPGTGRLVAIDWPRAGLKLNFLNT